MKHSQKRKHQEETPGIHLETSSHQAVPPAPLGNKHAISIDFGTTHTATAASSQGKTSLIDFDGEPDPDANGKFQTPTTMLYVWETDPDGSEEAPKKRRIFYGHEVAEKLAELGAANEDLRAGSISLFKLMLDSSNHLEDMKYQLGRQLQSLKRLEFIKEDSDMFRNFFTCILRRTKSRLVADYGYKDGDTVEVSLSIPVTWLSNANATMCVALETAMKEVRLGTDGESSCNIFLVSEPEAQAIQALQDTAYELQVNETFIIADCGGGTLDLAMFRISIMRPLRLVKETTAPKGAAIGASALNQRFRQRAITMLKKETYLLEFYGMADIDTIVDAYLVPEFERRAKKDFESRDDKKKFYFSLPGLKACVDTSNVFRENICSQKLMLTNYDMFYIFRLTTDAITDMVRDFVNESRAEGHVATKILLTGGFGDSRYLRHKLTEMIAEFNEKLSPPLELRTSKRGQSATSVATGGIRRSNDKSHGPSRAPSQSIGIVRHLQCGTEYFEALPQEVKDQEEEPNAVTKEEYIHDVIKWLITKNSGVLEPEHTVVFTSFYIFEKDEEEWRRREVLYGSDADDLIDYRKHTYWMDKGMLVLFGEVWFDVTHLKERIRADNRAEKKQYRAKGRPGTIIDSVTLRIEMTIIGRNLEFIARYPPTPDGQIIRGTRRHFSVAGALPVSAD